MKYLILFSLLFLPAKVGFADHYPAIAETQLPRKLEITRVVKNEFRLLKEFKYTISDYTFASERITDKKGVCVHFPIRASDFGLDEGNFGNEIGVLIILSEEFGKIASLGSSQVYSLPINNELFWPTGDTSFPHKNLFSIKWTDKDGDHNMSSLWHWGDYNAKTRIEGLTVSFGTDIEKTRTLMIPIYPKDGHNRAELRTKVRNHVKVYWVDEIPFSRQDKHTEQMYIEYK